jgi:hypothetical protein
MLFIIPLYFNIHMINEAILLQFLSFPLQLFITR